MANDPVYNEKIQAALIAVEKAEENPEVTDRVELSSGVILRFKKIPLLRINAIVDQFPYPPVPEIFDEAKGRVEKNPLSETYLEMCKKVDAERATAVVDAVVATGTVLEYKPDSVSPVESEDWIEELEVSHITIKKESKLARYLAWVKFVAIVDADDLGKIAREFGITLGVSESKIAAAIDNNFPNN
jgi:hypothetical protein